MYLQEWPCGFPWGFSIYLAAMLTINYKLHERVKGDIHGTQTELWLRETSERTCKKGEERTEEEAQNRRQPDSGLRGGLSMAILSH